jgi:AhpD family alkylhydroperoxidase
MSRISRIGRSQSAGAVRDTFERKIAEEGSIPNMYRTVAHRPWLLATLDAHLAAVMGSGTVPLQLKELLAVQTSRVNASEYCTRSYTALAKRSGITDDQIAALLDFENGPFDDKQKAALRYGLQVTRDATQVSDTVFSELTRHFTEPEIVEITCVVGLLGYFNRFNEALRVDPTEPGEGLDS